MDHLFAGLLDLLREFDNRQLPLTVGGGYGLYLKRRHLTSAGARTLFEALPEARSTNDIDLFLRADIVADTTRLAAVAEAVSALRYQPVDTAKFLQWTRGVMIGGVEQPMKLDILVGPLDRVRGKVKADDRRARAKGFKGELHAHPTEEALRIDENPIPVPVAGRTSDGDEYAGTVFVPEAFPYLLMKLHAFADQKDKAAKELGRHHAIDAYSVVGMMTEDEYDRAERFSREDRDTEPVRRARRIVAEDFGSETALGMLRMREHPLFHDEFETGQFIAVLRHLFAE